MPILVIFIILYLSIGIGTMLKFYEDMKPELFFRFLLFLPAQTMVFTVTVFFMLLPKMFKRRSLLSAPSVFITSLIACLSFMPIFAGKLAYAFIKSKNNTRNVIRETKHECAGFVEYALGH